MDFGFIGAAYQAQALIFDPETCVNLYPEVIEAGHGFSDSKMGLLGSPGAIKIGTFGDPKGRCLVPSVLENDISTNAMAYAISGTTLYQITYAGTISVIGTGLASETGFTGELAPCQIIVLGKDSLFVLSGGVCYNCTPSTATLTVVADLVGTFIRSCCYADSYIIVSLADSNVFQISGVGDPTSFDPLDFATKEGNPDFLQRVSFLNDYLILSGAQTFEVWQDTGNADFPFSRVSGAGVQQHGLTSTWAFDQADDTFIWLGTDARGQQVVWELRGLTPVRISTHAIEAQILFYDTQFSNAYTYQENGHFFWVVNFPGADATWVYDATEKLWHRRTSLTSGAQHIYLSRYHASTISGTAISGAVGSHLTLAAKTGALYSSSVLLFDEDGTAILRDRTGPCIALDNNRIIHNQLELFTQQGFGPQPTYNLYISDDGGYTYGAAIPILGGVAGDTLKRIIWWRLGQARRRVYRITSDTAIQHAWIGCSVLTQQAWAAKS